MVIMGYPSIFINQRHLPCHSVREERRWWVTFSWNTEITMVTSPPEVGIQPL